LEKAVITQILCVSEVAQKPPVFAGLVEIQEPEQPLMVVSVLKAEEAAQHGVHLVEFLGDVLPATATAQQTTATNVVDSYVIMVQPQESQVVRPLMAVI
jgi:hypothetical protein